MAIHEADSYSTQKHDGKAEKRSKLEHNRIPVPQGQDAKSSDGKAVKHDGVSPSSPTNPISR